MGSYLIHLDAKFFDDLTMVLNKTLDSVTET